VHFISLEFFILVSVTLAIYYLPYVRRMQVPALIVSSLVFYGYGQPLLLALLVFTSLVAGAASYLALAKRGPNYTVPVAVCTFLLILAFFKYKFLPFFEIEHISASAIEPVQFVLMLPLPIGISFYTFQAISLVIDSRKKEYIHLLAPYADKPLKYIQDSFFYIIFFPQLVAGPIVKAHEFLPQISRKKFRDVNLEMAITAILTGLFFKVFIADNLNVITGYIDVIVEEGGSNLIDVGLLTFAFGIQIYADFFGYTLMAIGIAALFGYRLPENFDAPYLAISISDFWRRWHISLSSFLREYLYVPLGGNRKGSVRTYLNLIIVMGLGGLWHGAALSFMIWGLYHGIGLAIERPLLARLNQFSSPVALFVRGFGTFVFATFGWVFFKLNEFGDVVSYFGYENLQLATEGLLSNFEISIIIFMGCIVFIQQYLNKRRLKNRYVASVVYGMMLVSVVLQPGGEDAFIYFQF
jgi:alginate O-acetyltransferase complex protein AlgI